MMTIYEKVYVLCGREICSSLLNVLTFTVANKCARVINEALSKVSRVITFHSYIKHIVYIVGYCILYEP